MAPSERARNGRSGHRCRDLWLMTIKHILGELWSRAAQSPSGATAFRHGHVVVSASHVSGQGKRRTDKGNRGSRRRRRCSRERVHARATRREKRHHGHAKTAPEYRSGSMRSSKGCVVIAAATQIHWLNHGRLCKSVHKRGRRRRTHFGMWVRRRRPVLPARAGAHLCRRCGTQGRGPR